LTERPLVDDFERSIGELRSNPILSQHIKSGEAHLGSLTLDGVIQLMKADAGYYFLIAAAGLNRTSLKKASAGDEAKIVAPAKRRAFAIKERLPVRKSFADIASSAVALRRGDLNRKSRGGIEALFRERLVEEGIGVLMSPPVRQVPGILIGRRKPDGVYPDPALGYPPVLYLEIKNVRRVADDIQKRLYEIAEAAIEMKFLYGALRIDGLALHTTAEVLAAPQPFRAKLRTQIVGTLPIVVVLMLCSRVEAERYREGAQAFVDRVFFQEEIEECLSFLRETVDQHRKPL
jgi:hypothetical protein